MGAHSECAELPQYAQKLSVELRHPATKISPDTKVLPGKLLKMVGTFNRKQKICLWAVVAVIAAMVVYPPWIARLTDQGAVHSQNRIGYAWLWAPPKLRWLPYGARFTLEVAPNLARLAVQCTAVAIITFSLMVAFKNNQNRKVKVLIIAIHALIPVVCAPFFIDVLPTWWQRCLPIGLPFLLPLVILLLFELKRA